MTKQTKIAVTFGALVIVFMAVFVAMQLDPETEVADATPTPAPAATLDGNQLGQPGSSNVTLVEYLDFECPACGAAFPEVEKLRERYDGRVTFVTRYFPIPGHANAKNAAYAAEAAARQGKYEQMYRKLFTTQRQWAGRETSQAALFREYAQDLGLDMATYDADVASPEVAARVSSDFDEGRRLGVGGTPWFFLNGTTVEGSTFAELSQAIDSMIGQAT
jgi:protein-disulfide isomerase